MKLFIIFIISRFFRIAADARPVLVQLNMQYLMNITWGMPEPLALKRAALYYKLNDSDATMTYLFS